MAEKYRFHILAPTSERGASSPTSFESWESGARKALSGDEQHVLSCMDELATGGRVTIDGAHVLLVGYGGGGRAALHLASHSERFSHYGVLHASPELRGLGHRKLPGFFSAGKQDAAFRNWLDVVGSLLADPFDFCLNALPGILPTHVELVGFPEEIAPMITDWNDRFGVSFSFANPIDTVLGCFL